MANALRHLRETYIVCFLWVDALCINQYNLEEKAEQVRVMLSTFQKASRVVVWLGERSVAQQMFSRSSPRGSGIRLVLRYLFENTTKKEWKLWS
jgi:hypothetical protein